MPSEPRDRDPRLERWRELVRERLPALPVEEARRAMIEDELAHWLRDACEQEGVDPTDKAAFETWLAGEVPVWEELANSLVRAGRPVAGRAIGRQRLQRIRSRMTVGILGDLRYAIRSIRKSPGFTIVAILTLAVGIGMNSAVFSLLNSVIFKPLPIEREQDLVRIFSNVPRGFFELEMMAYPDYQDLATRIASLDGVGGFQMTFIALEGADRADLVFGEMVTGSYFQVLGLKPVRGRLIEPSDDLPSAPGQVAVLSHASWRARFGGDENIVGREIRVNGSPLTVVGIAPPGFKSLFRGTEMEIWIPINTAEILGAAPSQSSGDGGDESMRAARGRRWLWTFGRRAAGASFEQVTAEIEALGAALQAEYPDTNEDRNLRTMPMKDVKTVPGVDAGIFAASSVLLGVVGLVLLIACANLANLLLARALGRHREMATRLSLGATAGALVRQLLLESLLLAGAGAAVGLAVAWLANIAVNSVSLPMIVPISVTVALDARVVGFTLLVAVATALLFGLAPAIQASRPDLAVVLREEAGARGGSAKRRRLQGALVVAQVSLSVVLLAFGGLSLPSAMNAQDLDLGFEPQGAVAMTLAPSLQGYEDEQISQFYPALKRELEATPGVTSVTASSHLPLTLWINSTGAIAEGKETLERDQWPEVDVARVDEDYFATMSTPIVMGRDFEAVECHEERRVTIVNETLARRFWPGVPAPSSSASSVGWGSVLPLSVSTACRPTLSASGLTRSAFESPWEQGAVTSSRS